MTSTAKRVYPSTESSTDWGLARGRRSEDYQLGLVAVDVEDYKMKAETPSTAKGHLTRRNSTVVTSAGGVPRAAARSAEWDGYVVDVGLSSFTAVLRGIAGEGVKGESHDAEIALDDVGPSDRTLLRPGSFFRLCIYSEVDDDDRPKRFSKVIFRRLPAYRQTDLNQADRRAEERHRKLRVE